MTEEYEQFFASPKGNNKQKKDGKIRSKSQVYKGGSNILAEAVVIGEHNRPYWIISDSLTGQITVHEYIESIDEEGNKKVLYAPKKSTYLNEPYTFESIEQINELIQDVKANETLDTLFTKVKKQWRRYVNQSETFINLCCADCIFTLFQDKLGSTHYLFFLADTEAGKSANLIMLKVLGYRCFLGVDISTSNIYRFYGNEYEGIGTLCEDEVIGLDEQLEKLKLYKSGYTKGFKVPKNLKPSESAGVYEQEGYYTFGLKAFTAEEKPTSANAKGFNERLVEMACEYGIPEEYIEEVLNDAGDPHYKVLLAELTELKNRLLIYRLIHYFDPILRAEFGLHARERQLWTPLLRIFQNNSKTLAILKESIYGYVAESRRRKSHSHVVYLVKLISKLAKNVPDNKTSFYTLETSTIWSEYKKGLPEGEDISKQSFTSPEFGDVSQKALHEMLCDKLHAKPPTHTGKKRELVFHLNTLEKLRQKYRITDEDISEDDGNDDKDNQSKTDETLKTHETLVGKNRDNIQENSESNQSNNDVKITTKTEEPGNNFNTTTSDANTNNANNSINSSQEASQASEVSHVHQILGSYVAFDFEWDATNDNIIDAVSFVDSNGNSEVKLRERDFDGSEIDLLRYIMA
jgi:hypothetical protein